ncbi:MAG: hypothetical protein ACRDJL_01595 [Actinomycetota bacterium]
MSIGARLLMVATCSVLLTAQPIGATGTERSQGKRVETKSYMGTSPVVASHVLDFYASACSSGSTDGDRTCLRFDLKRSDRFISLEIEDDVGNPVYGIAWDDSDDFVVEFCGKTTRPVASPGGDFFYVEVVAANTRLGCFPSAVTQGEVTATFTHRRK